MADSMQTARNLTIAEGKGIDVRNAMQMRSSDGAIVQLEDITDPLTAEAVAALPTSDPGVPGTFWLDSGVLTLSGGGGGSLFVNQNDALLNTVYESNFVTLDNSIDPAVVISISGGTYSKNYGFYTSSAGIVSPGDVLSVKGTSSGSVSTDVNVVITIDGVPGTWKITTAANLLNDVPGSVAAWSTARQLIDTYVSGVFMTQAAGVVTLWKEQIAGRDATPSGSPAVGTGTIGASPFIKFDGVNDKFSFTALALGTGDWTMAFAFGTGGAGTSPAGAIVGSTATTMSIRGAGGANNFDFRSNSAGPVSYNTLYAGGAFGFHIMIVTHDAATNLVTVYWNGEPMGTPVGRTVTGAWTPNQFGVSLASTAFSSMGLGEAIMWGRKITEAEIEFVTANMKNQFPNGTFVDFTAGNDSNIGWNEDVPLKTIGAARLKVNRRGTKMKLKCGEVWRRDPLLLNAAGQEGIVGDHFVIESYGAGALPKLIGSELMNPAGWVNTVGTEYSQTLVGLNTFEGMWAVKGTTTVETRPGVTVNIPAVTRMTGGTAGALAVGEYNVTGTLITVNVGESPATWDIEVGHLGNGYADNQGDLIRVANRHISVKDLQGWFAPVDCFRHNNDDTAFYRTQSWYAKADGHGGEGLDFYEEEPLSYFPGKGRVGSGPDGDAYSIHQGSTGVRVRPVGVLADKAGLDDGDDCIVTNYAPFIRGCNRNIFNYDSPAAGGGVLTFIHPVIVRMAGDNGYCAEFTNQVNAVVSHGTFINEDVAPGTVAIRHNDTGSTTVLNTIMNGFENSIVDDNSGTLTNNYNLQDVVSTYGPGVTPGPNDIHADPIFVDAVARDYRLDTGSPGINAASDGSNIGAL